MNTRLRAVTDASVFDRRWAKLPAVPANAVLTSEIDALVCAVDKASAAVAEMPLMRCAAAPLGEALAVWMS